MKKILKITSSIVFSILAIVLYFFWKDAHSNKYDVIIDNKQIPIFTNISLPNAINTFDSKESLPLIASAVFDIDNDGTDEFYLGGGFNQPDKFFKFSENKFSELSNIVEIETKRDNTSLGCATADFDNNGFTDLIIAREDGLHLYYNTSGKFTHKALKISINQKSTPVGITLGDIDNDGDLDIFLSTYLKKDLMKGQTIFMDKSYGSTSALLQNEGEEQFKNITVEAGLDYIHNTFTAILVDIDGDGHLDIVVAHDTGEVRTYKNNGNSTFLKIENPLTNKYAYPMGIAAGDYNNDGLIDFMFSNTGSTLPSFMAKGDIDDTSKFNGKWILFENKGKIRFEDVASDAKISDYEFSWGAVFADMNNDGLKDLMVAENYVDFLPNKLFKAPSRLLLQKPDHTFVPTENQSGVKNLNYAITPLISDFNNDGNLDLIWINLAGKSYAYQNNGIKNNFLKVRLLKNAKNIGAKIEIITPTKKLYEWVLTGEGLSSDQSNTLHFGLGNEKNISKVTVNYLNGKADVYESVKINSTLTIN